MAEATSPPVRALHRVTVRGEAARLRRKSGVVVQGKEEVKAKEGELVGLVEAVVGVTPRITDVELSEEGSEKAR